MNSYIVYASLKIRTALTVRRRTIFALEVTDTL